jgi:phosphoenolpyruvate-protein phosphotransferase (PTS system enzyme I)
VLITLKHVINAGHKNGKWVGICGELAGNPLATALLIGMGMDELSVVPAVLPEIKKIIRSLTYTEMVALAREVLVLTSADKVETTLRQFLKKRCPDIPIDTKRTS